MKEFIKQISVIALLLMMVISAAFAHGGKDHGKAKQDSTQTASHQAHENHTEKDSTQSHAAMESSENHEHGLAEFPSLHPLVVHFPIVLLIIAALLQWVGFFVYKKEITIVAWALLGLGYIGAYASSSWFHAHTAQLSPAIQAVLVEHEQYASYTQWLSGIAWVIQSANLFFLKRNFWVNLTVSFLITAAAIFVAYAGHHGAELVHKYGVGAKGNLLEQHHH